jgi:hypothetical protein
VPRVAVVFASVLALTACASTGSPGSSEAAAVAPKPPTAAAQSTSAEPAAATAPRPQAPATPGQPRPFADVIKDAKRTEGFFAVWRKDEKLWIELHPGQLDKPFYFSTVLTKGLAQTPFVPGLHGDSNVASFRRIGNQVQLVALNTEFRAPDGSPLQHAVRAVSDSLLASGTVASADHPERKSFLIDANALLLTDIGGTSTTIETAFRLPYALDRANSSIDRVRASAEATAIAVNLHFAVPKLPAPPATPPAPGTPRPTPPSAIPDPRSFFLGMQYRFAPLPESPMPVRLADERVGYFVSEYRDLAADYSKDARTRVISRWRLEKKDPAAALSEPKQPIVAYLDRNIPADLRPAVEAGVLEWNKAYEQAGFKDAIVIRRQPDDADWDVLEGRHLAIKWFVDAATAGTTAIGPRQVDPRTGEILHGSALIPELWARFSGSRFGETLPPRAQQTDHAGHLHGPQELCTFAFDALEQASFTFELMEARGQLVRDSAAARAFIDAAIKAVVMHEVGHALGLRHNFKASAAIAPTQLQDRAFTAANGTSASIMDYLPENIPADADRQVGSVHMDTVGAYDRWAVEYGYRQFAAAEEGAALEAIAARSVDDPRLAYATDEDAGGDSQLTGFPPGIDPLTNRFDLGADPLAYFDRQFRLVRELWRRTERRKLDADDDYVVYRRNLERGLRQLQAAAPGMAKYLGGVYVSRVRAGSGRPLLTPVEPARQREALRLLTREVFQDSSFRFDPQFMRRLGIDQFARFEGGTLRGPDFSLPEAVLRIQRSALDQLMSDALAQRLADAESKVDDPRTLLTYAEVQATLTDAVWSELRAGRDIDSLRRNLQREHLRRLAGALLRPTPTAATDVRPAHRAEAQKLQAQLARAANNGALNPATRAHLGESLATLREALAAPLNRQGA